MLGRVTLHAHLSKRPDLIQRIKQEAADKLTRHTGSARGAGDVGLNVLRGCAGPIHVHQFRQEGRAAFIRGHIEVGKHLAGIADHVYLAPVFRQQADRVDIDGIPKILTGPPRPRKLVDIGGRTDDRLIADRVQRQVNHAQAALQRGARGVQ